MSYNSCDSFLWFGSCMRACHYYCFKFDNLKRFVVTFVWAEMLILVISCTRVMHDPVLSVWSSPLHPSEPVLLCCYCWRKECPHDLCQVVPWPKRLPPWQNCHPAAHARAVSQCHVCPSGIVTVCPGSALLRVADPCYCHLVSAWLTRAGMQRAVPQLSKTEMGFDFRNPVASVHHCPLTWALTEQECTVTPSRRTALSHCDNEEKGVSNFHTCSCFPARRRLNVNVLLLIS